MRTANKANTEVTALILTETVDQYLRDQVPARSPLLTQMEKEAANEHIPIIDPRSAYFLHVLVKMLQPMRILEIGTAIGYSTIWLAKAAEKARLTTIESDPERMNRALSNFEEAGLRDRIELLEADAAEGLPGHYSFDFIFIDAAKKQYQHYVETYLPYLKSRGVIVCDNTLFKGYVAQESDAVEPSRWKSLVEHLKQFNVFLRNHPDLDTSFIPVGDGLSVSVYQPESD